MKQIIHGATSEHASDDLRITRYSTDTRTLQPGDWFLCLKGEHMDGHDHMAAALEAGAAGVIADPLRLPAELAERPFPRLLVPDPNRALREWAADFRQRFTGTVLGITGSSGKTSTKEILASLCRSLDARSHATEVNYNNLIGVPKTILSGPLEADWWVLEMGTNQHGEIEALSQMAQPDGGILTNIGESHLEFLGSTEGVAREKSGLFSGMKPESPVVIPHDLLHRGLIQQAAQTAGVTLLPYSLEPQGPDSTLTAIEWTPDGVQFQWQGAAFQAPLHNPLHLRNLVASLTLLAAKGVALPDLQHAVEALQLNITGRFQQLQQDGWMLIDDSYNANPDSFRSMISSLRQMFPHQRLLLAAGPMAELGEWAPMLHRQVAQAAASWGVSAFWTLADERAEFYEEGWREGSGAPEAFSIAADHQQLATQLRQSIQPGDVVLIKGSRSTHMEQVSQLLQAP